MRVDVEDALVAEGEVAREAARLLPHVLLLVVFLLLVLLSARLTQTGVAQRLQVAAGHGTPVRGVCCRRC